MEATLQKELKQLQKRKLKAQTKGDIFEEARLCNATGELLSQYGYHEKAVKEHMRELQLSEGSQDTIGCAIAHRKVGECLCQLNKYKEALSHQNLHLELARSAGDLVEEQRAFATIGRTWFFHSDTAASNEEVEECLFESQAAYLKSLSICDKLRETVTEKELLEMRSRLYLNLGLTYENQKDPSRAKRFMEKALDIARNEGLNETVYRCYYALGSVRMKYDEDAYALRCFEQALHVARKGNNKFDEADALLMLGKVFLKLGEFPAGRRNLKKAYTILRARRSDDMEELKSNLVASIKGIKLQRKYIKLSEYSLDEQIKILENLGDIYCQVKAFQKALGCYKKELELALKAEKPCKVLSSIYVSLAITYSDLKRPADAINCYKEELKMMPRGNYKEMCDTWCNIANVHEVVGHDYQEIKDAYMKAVEYAQLCGKSNVLLRVWNLLADTQKLFSKTEEYGKTCGKVLELKKEFGVEEYKSDKDEESEEEDGVDGSDDDREVLIEQEMLLQDSDDNDDEEDEPQSTSRSRPRRTQQHKQLNEKGETPLHEAAIAGNLSHVRALLEKGADVNARDYCGWLPLHEACNHGHKDITELLVKAGANVNDQGGTHCQGITPLHDAAANGHIEVVKVLLSHHASVNLKDNNGLTALDTAVKLQKLDEEDDGSGVKETKYTIGRRQVIKFLRSVRGERGNTEIRRRDAIFDEDDDSNTERKIMEQSNDKLNQLEKEQDKTQRPSLMDDFCEGDSNEVYQTQERWNALISDEEDSPQNLCEVSLNIASSSRVLTRTANASVTNTFKESVHSFSERHSMDLCGDAQSGSDPVELDEVDLCDDDSNYASTDEDDGFECLNVDYGSPVLGSNSASCGDTSITEPRSQSALLSVKDWLVDDIGHKPTKRKRPAKQTKLPVSVERHKRVPPGPKRQARRQDSNLQRMSRPKQSRLSLSRETRTNHNIHSQLPSVDTVVSSTNCTPSTSFTDLRPVTAHCRENTPMSSERHSTASSSTPPMRLRVKVQERVFLIPCSKCNDQESPRNIAWLAEQASLRYYSSSGLRPVLALKTSDGAILSPDDNITDVLSSNEEVIAAVESWDLPALSERYRKACISTNTSMALDILRIFEAEPQLSVLTLKNKALQNVHVLPLFRALQCHDCLTKLLLPGNRIGDSGIQHLVSALPTLPSLAVLDLRSNGITHKGLSFIASALTAREFGAHQTQQESKLLHKLRELEIGFNCLSDSAANPLACILHNCQCLTILKIDSCGLSSEFTAQGKEFSIALKASKLQVLSFAYNPLSPSGVTNLARSLPSMSLQYLNLTSSLREMGSKQSAIQSLVEFTESGCVLHDIILCDCSIGTKELEQLAQAKHSSSGLQYLDLSCNKIGSDALPFLTRLLKQNAHLTTLILDGNEGLGNTGAAALMSLAKDSQSLQKLSLAACHVRSPLDESFLETVKGSSSQRQWKSSLKEVDLSHNLLNTADKCRLTEEWDEHFACDSLSLLDKNVFVLKRS